jgi:CHAD domain-containing protein
VSVDPADESFLLDGSATLPSVVRDLRSRLAAALPDTLLTGTAAAGSTTRHRWYDTFDWRLHRAGLELDHIELGGRSVLTLRRTGQPVDPAAPDGVLATEELPFEAPVRFAGDLPPGDLRELLSRRIAPRALLALADVTAQQVTLPILDTERKTVVRLRVEAPRLAGRVRTPLPTRVSVLPLRGYAGPAERVASVLAGELAAAANGPGLLVGALTALGRVPGDYTGKLAVSLHPGETSAAALAAILGHLQDTVDANLDGTLRAVDTEFLHDLRVAVRRARSAVKLLSGAFPPAVEQQLAAELRWLGAVTGPPRDLDVLQLLLDEVGQEWPAGATRDLAAFADLLSARAATEQAKLRRALRSRRYIQLRTLVRSAVAAAPGPDAGPAAHRSAGPLGLTPIGALGAKRLRRISQRVLRDGNAIHDDSPGEALHDLRKRCKELRYLLELLAPVFPADRHARVVRELKALQETLGDFQDGEVQRDAVREAAVDLHLAAGPGRPDHLEHDPVAVTRTLLAMGRLAGEMDTRQQHARASFDARWERFSAPDNVRDLAVLGDAK